MNNPRDTRPMSGPRPGSKGWKVMKLREERIENLKKAREAKKEQKLEQDK